MLPLNWTKMSYHKGLEEIEQSVNKKNSLNTLYKKSARLNKLNYVLSQRIPQIELSLSSILKAGKHLFVRIHILFSIKMISIALYRYRRYSRSSQSYPKRC